MPPRLGLFTVLASVALVAGGAAQEPIPQRPTLGKPIVRDSDPRDAKRSEESTPTVIVTKAKPTPLDEQRRGLGLPVATTDSATPFSGRVSLRADGGDGIGYSRGFGYLEAMIPLHQTNGSLFFSDLRVVNFGREDRWEGNLGVGYRWFSEPVNRILGANLFYDARRTSYHTYQQIGAGFEVLSPSFEFRVNGYFIAGPAHYAVGDPVFFDRGILNGNIVTQRYQPIETARGGVDLEFGGLLPFLDRIAPRAYAGFYSYSAAGAQTINGIRGRLEAQLTPQISAHFAIQRDQIFDTTVTGGLAFHFGAPAYRSGNAGRASWEDVLRQRINRDVNIVVTQEQGTGQLNRPVLPPPPPPPPPPEEGEGQR